MRVLSVRQVVADGALILGGVRAILLQIAAPAVGAAVAAHSDFANRPMERLHNSLTFVYSVLLGTPEQARAAARFVDRTHSAISGADDPARQLWVAATIYETATVVHDALWGPLDDQTADETYRSYAAIGTALQVPPNAWPADRAAFRAYWDIAVAGLQVTDDAQRVAAELTHPTGAPWWVRATMPFVVTVTAGLLPAPLRSAFGLPLRPVRFRVALAVARGFARMTPRRVREWPARHYLRRFSPPSAD